MNTLTLRSVALGILTVGLLLSQAHGSPPNPDTRRSGPVRDKIKSVSLYCVVNGVTKQLNVQRKDLDESSGLKVPGHVWGVVAFCDDDVTPLVGDTPLTKISENRDGTLSIRYFGNVPARELPVPPVLPSFSGNTEGSMANGYSLFPVIKGDALVPEDDFLLSFESEGARFSIPIHQKGYRTLYTLSPDDPDNTLAFGYLGTDPKAFQLRTADFLERLRAIEQGIRNVESLFQMDLVNQVNIVEFDELYGGVTEDGDAKTMWMYSRAILRESPAELTHMASHETLHRYITSMGWTKNSRIRELFSEVKGYDLFSRERFQLVTRGITPSGQAGKQENRLFFAFINERNFLEGSRGGHSDADLDEFCASFFHSLMYVGRLGGNLFQPVCVWQKKGEVEKTLTQTERMRVLDLYARTIQGFLDAASDATGSGETSMDPIRRLLEVANKNVRTLQVTCSAEDSRSGATN